MLGRYLYSAGYYQEAAELLLSIETAQMQSETGHGFSDQEAKAWAMYTLGLAFWRLNDCQRALRYVKLALTLAEEEQTPFEIVVRGEIWGWYLRLLNQAGQPEQARKLAWNKISSLMSWQGSNSYIFYSFYYLAEKAKQEGDISRAAKYIRHGLRYFPIESHEEPLILKNANPAGLIQLAASLMSNPYRVWQDEERQAIEYDREGI